jgi:hypothetical protein
MAAVDVAFPPAGAPAGDGDAATSVPVVCGALTGVLLLPRRRILINAGTAGECEVSPTEFERLGGKGRAKKWWMSIRTQDGTPGGAPARGWGAGGVRSRLAGPTCAGAGATTAPRQRPAVVAPSPAPPGSATVGEWLVARGFDPSASQRSLTSKLGLGTDNPGGAPLHPNGSGGSNPMLFSAGGSGPSGISNATGSGLLNMSSGEAVPGGGDGLYFAPPLPRAGSDNEARLTRLQQQQQRQQQHQRFGGSAGAPPLAEAHLSQGLLPSAAIDEHLQWGMAPPPPPHAAALPQLQPAGEGWGSPPAPPGARAPAPAPALMPLGGQRLPGDGSEAVAAMADYLVGLAPSPPLHLLQRGGPPVVDGRALDLRALFGAVVSRGGYAAVTSGARWQEVLLAIGLEGAGPRRGGGGVVGAPAFRLVHAAYVDLLLRFERMYDLELWEAVTGRPVRGGVGDVGGLPAWGTRGAPLQEGAERGARDGRRVRPDSARACLPAAPARLTPPPPRPPPPLCPRAVTHPGRADRCVDQKSAPVAELRHERARAGPRRGAAAAAAERRPCHVCRAARPAAFADAAPRGLCALPCAARRAARRAAADAGAAPVQAPQHHAERAAGRILWPALQLQRPHARGRGPAGHDLAADELRLWRPGRRRRRAAAAALP